MPERTVKTRYYEFSQNNSGGRWVNEPKLGIGYKVWIEALSPEHANQRAETIGIYFDGVNDGRDCDCCGDRWDTATEYNAMDDFPIEEYLPGSEKNKYSRFYVGQTVYVHPLEGPFSSIKINE